VITTELLEAIWEIDPDIQVRIYPGSGAVLATVALERIVNGERYVYAQDLPRWEVPGVLHANELLRGARFMAEKVRAALERKADDRG
jgi:hypothetical protein